MKAHLLRGCRVTVLGAGRSGLAAAKLLCDIGARVFVSDGASIGAAARSALRAEFSFEEGGHSERALEATDLLVLSPGVSINAPIVQLARARQIPIWGELELAYRFCPSAKIIAVTGTNGKSTTTLLIARLLAKAGLDVVSAGNLGIPLSERLKEITPETVVVLEVSSFQLESIERFRPQVAVFLNIAPNHLDRHGSFSDYFASKCRIFANQRAEDFLVAPRHLEFPIRPRSQLIFYDDLLRELENLKLADHWQRDAAAALAAARLFVPGLPPPQLHDLPQLPHRQEFVAEVAGVKFYDDSKATTIHATLAALSAIPGPVVLILGGRAKEPDFTPLTSALRRYEICEVMLIGESAPQIAQSLQAAGFTRFVFIESFDEAVQRALRYPGASCLLSPACASFDLFANYEERGEAFRQAVFRLPATALRKSLSVAV